MYSKFIKLLTVLLLTSFGVIAQTPKASIEHVEANPGSVDVTIKLENFKPHMGAVTISIGFDTELCDFTGIKNMHPNAPSGWMFNTLPDGLARIVWTDMDAAPDKDMDLNGDLVTMRFNYTGGLSTPLTWIDKKGYVEFAYNSMTIINNVELIHGSISQQQPTNATIKLDHVTGNVASDIIVPLTMSGTDFAQLNAATFHISYDKDVISFKQINKKTMGSAIANAEVPGLVKINWNNTTTADFSDNANPFDLVFHYKGGVSNIDVASGTLFTLNDDGIGFSIENGSVAPASGNGSLTIASINALAGQNIIVPVTAENIIDQVGAITLNISYDNTKLDYKGFDAKQFTGWTPGNVQDGIIKLTATNADGAQIADGDLLELKFFYKEGVETEVKFAPATQIADVNAAAIQLVLNNGAVAPIEPELYIISGGEWTSPSSWENNTVPGPNDNVIVKQGTTAGGNTYIKTAVAVNNITIEEGAKLTVLKNNGNGNLSLIGDITIKSSEKGQGSLVSMGTTNVGGKVYTEMFINEGKQWRGISQPVAGNNINSFLLNQNPKVYMKEYNEVQDSYTYATNINTPVGDMKGWMLWIDNTEGHTYTLEGELRTGEVTPSFTLTRSGNGPDRGLNFVGNPYTSAIDWGKSAGWTKENLNNKIQVYKNGVWAIHGDGMNINGGSPYVAMNQGFFVQVKEGSSTGTLKINREAQTHNSIPFKGDENVAENVIKLSVTDGDLVDEMAVGFNMLATKDFNGDFDAPKLKNFNAIHPEIFTTSGDEKYAIKFYPELQNFTFDVNGVDGNLMSISATMANDFEYLYIKDNHSQKVFNLKEGNYFFENKADVKNRFEVNFNITNIEEQQLNDSPLANIFAQDGTISVNLFTNENCTIYVYNLLGQTVAQTNAQGTLETINIAESGCYIVKIAGGNRVQSTKIVVK